MDALDLAWLQVQPHKGMNEEVLETLVLAFERATQEAVAALDPCYGLQYDANSVCDVCHEVNGLTG